MSETDTQTPCDCGCRGAGPLLTAFLRRLAPSEAVSLAVSVMFTHPPAGLTKIYAEP